MISATDALRLRATEFRRAAELTRASARCVTGPVAPEVVRRLFESHAETECAYANLLDAYVDLSDRIAELVAALKGDAA
jgi:hypothetical protein